MGFPEPQYSRGRVNRAGREVLDIIANNRLSIELRKTNVLKLEFDYIQTLLDGDHQTRQVILSDQYWEVVGQVGVDYFGLQAFPLTQTEIDAIRNLSSERYEERLAQIFSSLNAQQQLLSTYREHFDVFKNWRGAHGRVINTFQATLRKKASAIDPNAVVSQRLKREVSILFKLRREKERGGEMKLSRMQDIGGVRAIVKDMSAVRALVLSYNSPRLLHDRKTPKDYVQFPKESGYRSYHAVFKYRNRLAPAYEGLLVEIQLRTSIQHYWATAVEIVDQFLEMNLKAGIGDQKWLNFFALVSSAFAHIEGEPRVPGFDHMSRIDTFKEVGHRANQLNVVKQLQAFKVTISAAHQYREQYGSTGEAYYLLAIDFESGGLTLYRYQANREKEALQAYERLEERLRGKGNVVLVKTNFAQLKLAYPNYFADTDGFCRLLQQIKEEAAKT